MIPILLIVLVVAIIAPFVPLLADLMDGKLDNRWRRG